MTQVLRKGFGGYSAGTRVDVESTNLKTHTVLVRTWDMNFDDEPLEVPEDYIVTLRQKDGLTKQKRAELS